MAVCGACGREIRDSVSCVENPFRFFEDDSSVRVYAQVRYGEEEDDWGGKSGRPCHDCFCRPGDLHHTGCDVERCPRCGGQAIACDCFSAQSAEGSDARTLFFYHKEAAAYADRSDKIGPSKQLHSFISQLPQGAAVLDLGCGAGRDTKALIDAGLKVTALDGSVEMVCEAEKRTGIVVRIQSFEYLDDVAAFEGIWASASLLHVPRRGLANVLKRVYRAIMPGGLLYASFKSGGQEGRDKLGRYYNYLNADELTAFLHAAGAWASLDLKEGRGAGYDGTETGWVVVFARKAADGAPARTALD